MNLDKVVCECFGITNGMIKEAVENGATTLEEVQNATDAATACGACTDSVQHVIDYFTSERDN